MPIKTKEKKLHQTRTHIKKVTRCSNFNSLESQKFVKFSNTLWNHYNTCIPSHEKKKKITECRNLLFIQQFLKVHEVWQCHDY